MCHKSYLKGKRQIQKKSWILRNWGRIFLSDTLGGTHNCHHLWELWSEQRGVFQDSMEVLPAECSRLSTITAVYTIPACCLWSLVISPHHWVLISQRLSPEWKTSMAGEREIILNSSSHRLLQTEAVKSYEMRVVLTLSLQFWTSNVLDNSWKWVCLNLKVCEHFFSTWGL